ncbi:hypothetical protein Tcan_12025 [Toxocara canis]|uniref:ANF_receptor domain-containing protein n=1 Tax=Toxocara canis TaxID=6265 RepID=A0A0B2UVX2_TOXCA|nr:hypothetical protein Tcan_12025 [Toxocara canis]
MVSAVFVDENDERKFASIAQHNGIPTSLISFAVVEMAISVPDIICQQVVERCVAIFGPKAYPANLIASSYSNHLMVPHFHIEPRHAVNIHAITTDRSIDLFPPPRSVSDVLLAVVRYYKWTSLVLLYRNASGRALRSGKQPFSPINSFQSNQKSFDYLPSMADTIRQRK